MTSHRLSPDVNWFTTPAAVSVAYSEYFGERSRRLPRPEWRRGAFSRLLRGLADWVAGLRERQAMLDQLSGMSERDLADIGLTRGQIHAVFDPEFAHEQNAAQRAAAYLEFPHSSRTSGDLAPDAARSRLSSC